MDFRLFNPFEYQDLMTLLVPIFGGCLIFELIVIYFLLNQALPFQDLWTNVKIGAIMLVMETLSKAICVGGYFFLYQYAIFESLGCPSISLMFSWEWNVQHLHLWILLLLLDDFVNYWNHRLAHTVRLFWTMHVTHHSSEHLTFFINFRNGLLEPFKERAMKMPLVLLGFHPLMLVLVRSVSLTHQFFVHTEIVGKLGWIDKVLNTPSNHRVHHASNPHYLDHNYSAIFMIWDWIFGTYKEEDITPTYGITTKNEKNAYNLGYIFLGETYLLLQDCQQAPDWKTRFKLLFYPPSWQPENTTLTTAS